MASKAPIVQAKFDPRIYNLAFPLTKETSGTITRGYMIWDQTLPGYSGKAAIHYLYNPSTVSADYNMADATAQAALNFPNPGDTAQLAIPLSQTVNWTVMFDRTYELWGAYGTDGTPNKTGANVNDPSVIGVQSDIMQFMQFTGMLTNYSYGTFQSQVAGAGLTNSDNYGIYQGIMQMVPCYAYFGDSTQTNNLAYYGYISEWSPQITHWTQYGIPMRAVIDIYFTMLPPPQKTVTPNAADQSWTVLPTPTGGGVNGTLPVTSLLPTSGVAGR